jgi:DNA-binding MarR family transcriptional regulator
MSSSGRSEAARRPDEALSALQPLVTDEALPAALERFAVEAVGLTVRALSEVAAEVDLTLSQWRALVVIDAAPGSRVGTIADRVGMSVPSTSRLLRRLERAGAVAIGTDPTDARTTVVYPTDGGSAFRTIVAQRRLALLAEALGDGPSEIDPTVVAAINDIAQALAASGGTSR